MDSTYKPSEAVQPSRINEVANKLDVAYNKEEEILKIIRDLEERLNYLIVPKLQDEQCCDKEQAADAPILKQIEAINNRLDIIHDNLSNLLKTIVI